MRKTATLLPTTKRLKQLIHQHGSEWIIVQENVPVQCFSDSKIGTKICSQNLHHSRWVRPSDLQERT
jgi:hypothetical protein